MESGCKHRGFGRGVQPAATNRLRCRAEKVFQCLSNFGKTRIIWPMFGYCCEKDSFELIFVLDVILYEQKIIRNCVKPVVYGLI